MKPTLEQNELLADIYLKPLLAIVDLSLSPGGNILEIAEGSLEQMGKNLSTAQAVAGIMIDLEDVEKRKVQTDTFKAAVLLLKVRSQQRKETIKLDDLKTLRDDNKKKLQNALGF